MRIFSIVYFIVLFAILGSYLIYATPDDRLRLRVASADALAPDQNNRIAVWARDLSNGSIFDPGHTLEARWMNADLTYVNAQDFTTQVLPQNGETSMPIPKVPQVAVVGLEVQLKYKDEILKSVVLPANSFQQAQKIQYLPTDEPQEAQSSPYSVFAPAAFMFNAPNEIFITTFDHDLPVQGQIQIQQIYGQPANFPETLKISKTGITRTHLVLSSPADFQFTIGDKDFYTSFVPGNKPLHAVIDQPVLTPTEKPQLKITPIASMPTIYIDYFDGDAWIDRQIIPPHQVYGSKLNPNYHFAKNSPYLIYARVAASALPTPDTAQTFPLIVTPKPLNNTEQATFALQKLQEYQSIHPEWHALHTWLTANTPSQSQARVIRDYALALLATHHAPNLEIRVKSEAIEAQIFSQEKQIQKLISNIVIIFWFALGILVYTITALKTTRARQKLWQEITLTGAVPEGAQFQTISPVQIVLIILLSIGFCIALIYVMQII